MNFFTRIFKRNEEDEKNQVISSDNSDKYKTYQLSITETLQKDIDFKSNEIAALHKVNFNLSETLKKQQTVINEMSKKLIDKIENTNKIIPDVYNNLNQPLTYKEIIFVNLLKKSDYLNYKELAEKLGIKESSVRVYIRTIKNKGIKFEIKKEGKKILVKLKDDEQ